MKCPYCSAELADDAFSCPHCRARRVPRRTRAGVFSGWAAVVIGSQVALAWGLILAMLVAGSSLGSMPWQLLAVVAFFTVVTLALLWHSSSTRHLQWVSGNE
jgi:Zn-dependent membrane protease YugP